VIGRLGGDVQCEVIGESGPQWRLLLGLSFVCTTSLPREATWIAILLRERSERMSAGLSIGTLNRMQRRSFWPTILRLFCACWGYICLECFASSEIGICLQCMQFNGRL
jgi:hypothetical protein